MAGPAYIIDPKTGKLTPNPDYTPTSGAGDTSAQVDGSGRQFVIVNGKVVFLDGKGGTPTPVPVNQNPGHTTSDNTSNSTSYSRSDSTSNNTSFNSTPFAIQTNAGVYIYNPVDKSMSLIPGSNQMSPAEQAQYATQWNIAQLNATTSANNTATTEAGANARNSASLAGTAAEGSANRAQTAAEADAQRAFTGQQSRDQEAFTSGESLLSRAQQAGEFAATYALQKQQAQQAAAAQQLQAAKTYADLSAAPDLTGFKRFQQAGGGVLGNSIAAGATSLTPQGQLGAARALETAQAPATPIPDYVNPYAGIDLTKNPYLTQTAGQPLTAAQTQANALGAQWNAAHVPADGNQTAGVHPPGFYDGIGGPGTTYFGNAAPNASGAVQADAGIGRSGVDSGAAMSAPGTNAQTQNGAMQAAGVPSWVSGFAYGTDAPPIRREAVSQLPSGAPIDQVDDRFAHGTSHGPSGTFYGRTRYALGTLAHPVQQLGALHIDPNGGGYPPGYAHGTFITGDSTDPNDPAAGGAHPEAVTVEDPPGANNARAEVTPLTPPGVGPTEPDGDEGEDPERLAALLRAIADFLDKEDDDEDEQEGSPLGAMGKRFALGTMRRYAGGTDDTGLLDPSTTSPLDQQDVSTVLQTRQQTPFSVNPYSLDYQQTSPTARAIDASAFQTATGVPGSEIAFEADKYKPGGLARGSTYARELDEGV